MKRLVPHANSTIDLIRLYKTHKNEAVAFETSVAYFKMFQIMAKAHVSLNYAGTHLSK